MGGRSWIWAAMAVLGLALTGCGDSNVFEGASSDGSGSEAKVEAGRRALDERRWDDAIDVFGGLYEADHPDADVAKYLASAYVGKAGFDALTLLKEVAEAQKADSGDAESILYDSITRLFDVDGSGTITTDDLVGSEGKLVLLTKAIGYLLPGYGAVAPRVAAASAEWTPTKDQTFQGGLYAAVHAVLSVVAQLEYPRGSGTLLLTLDELQAHAADVIPDLVAPTTLDGDLALVDAAMRVLIDGVTGSVEGLDDNDIAPEFDKFLTEIGYLGDDTPQHVTDQELRDYLSQLLDSLGGSSAGEELP
ncbi:MAG: hypothetical protein HZB55_14895 [Deltaproteobacteria bacterium]|nr:hypothetical protein [Deltaproteobacteria bacterium]